MRNVAALVPVLHKYMWVTPLNIFYQCYGSGSEIRCLFLTAGSGRMGKKSGSGSGMNNPDHNSESLEIIFFWINILKFFDADPWWKNSDPGGKKFGSGRENIRIRNKHPGSVTLFSYLPSRVAVRSRAWSRVPCCTSRPAPPGLGAGGLPFPPSRRHHPPALAGGVADPRRTVRILSPVSCAIGGHTL